MGPSAFSQFSVFSKGQRGTRITDATLRMINNNHFMRKSDQQMPLTTSRILAKSKVSMVSDLLW